MKHRIRKIVNFFAFNLLFFALYLNFIHKDKTVAQPMQIKTNAAVISGTVPVQDAEKYLNAKTSASVAGQQSIDKNEQNSALKPSVN